MKAAILITARLKSQRLPRKVLKELQGRPVLAHQVDRLRRATVTDRIILCTSDQAEDDPLAEAAQGLGLAVYRGHPDDVLLRLTTAAEEAGAEAVFNCTADNIFIDPGYLDRQMRCLVEEGYDYVYNYGIPSGTFGWALSVPAMRAACSIKDEVNTEIWGRYFTDTGRFRFKELEVDPADTFPGLRLHLDTPEDWQLISALFEGLYQPGQVFDLAAILDFCRAHPELPALNAGYEQRLGDAVKLKTEANDAGD